MRHHERALLLLKKASEDEALLDEILTSEVVSDEIIGFHCQQAVEKMLKAVLSKHEVSYRKTHDLQELLSLISDHGIQYPDNFGEVDELSPYAVIYRYDVPPEEQEEPLDREFARSLVARVRLWAEKILEEG
jgi:HEPN domain-containing protein